MIPNLPAAHIDSDAANAAAQNVPALIASLPAGYHTSKQLRAIQYAIARANPTDLDVAEALSAAYARAILSRFPADIRDIVAHNLSVAFGLEAAPPIAKKWLAPNDL